MPGPHPIYALWAHPRSMSTACERIMRERGDLDCLHEPFMYDYYIHRQSRRMPMFRPEPGHPVSYDEVRAMILERATSGPVFLKDMSYYVMPHLPDDAEFCRRITHAFLIRDPAAAIASYHALDPEVTQDEIGIEAQWRHAQALRAMGLPFTVLRAEAIRDDPRGTMSGWWRAVGLPEAPQAFDWQGAPPRDWQQVSGWHGDVMQARRIRPQAPDEAAGQMARFEAAAARRPDLRDLLEHHREFYDLLSDCARQQEALQ